jgi:acyl-CoA dehydrogenase
VHAALLAYLAGVARRSGWPEDALERIVAELVATRSLALEPPSAPEVHVALAGLLEAGRALLREYDALWASVEPSERERWARDRPLLEVASSARAARRSRAWQRLGL